MKFKIKENDDKKHVNKVRKALKNNGGYCPCKLEKNDDNKCICKDFLQQSAGECDCGLYIKY